MGARCTKCVRNAKGEEYDGSSSGCPEGEGHAPQPIRRQGFRQQLSALTKASGVHRVSSDTVSTSTSTTASPEQNHASRKGDDAEAGVLVKPRIGKEDLDFIRCIGKGAFGKVVLVRRRGTEDLYAMKILEKRRVMMTTRQMGHTIAERRILQKIDHSFLARLRFAFQTSTKLYLLTDFFSGGELFYHLRRRGRFTANQARFFGAEIILGIQYLHEQGICYRDLKPENVLLDAEGHVKLTDFGLSKMCDPEQEDQIVMMHTFCGTPEYLAPEVLLHRQYSSSIDWWSLGALLFEMLEGRPPFFHRNRKKMFDLVIRGVLHFQWKRDHGDMAVDLIRRLLRPNPNSRLRDVERIRQHPFFEDMDWDVVLARGLVPPFGLGLQGPVDVRHFDPQFTQIPLHNEVCSSPMGDCGGALSEAALQNAECGLHFADFTYVQENPFLAPERDDGSLGGLPLDEDDGLEPDDEEDMTGDDEEGPGHHHHHHHHGHRQGNRGPVSDPEEDLSEEEMGEDDAGPPSAPSVSTSDLTDSTGYPLGGREEGDTANNSDQDQSSKGLGSPPSNAPNTPTRNGGMIEKITHSSRQTMPLGAVGVNNNSGIGMVTPPHTPQAARRLPREQASAPTSPDKPWSGVASPERHRSRACTAEATTIGGHTNGAAQSGGPHMRQQHTMR